MIDEASRIRRIVTGHAPDGTAIVVSDGPAPNAVERPNTGVIATLLWTTAESPAAFSNADRGNVRVPTAPPRHGTILRVVEFPAHSERRAGLGGMELKHADSVRRAPSHPAMHATDTVDYAIVIEGEIDMLLDDSDVHMRTGDIMVQQGTNHAWVNRGDRPCKIAFVLVDAEGSPLIPPE